MIIISLINFVILTSVGGIVAADNKAASHLDYTIIAVWSSELD